MYDSRQMECCGEPFSVGDEVSWPLLMLPAPARDASAWQDCLTTLEAPDGTAGDGTAGDGTTLVRGPGLVAIWTGEDRVGKGAELSGYLSVERHGGTVPGISGVSLSAGTVSSLHVVTQGYAVDRTGSGAYEAVPDERWLRPVTTCPKWFSTLAQPPAPRREDYRRLATGVLVGLTTG
ncbi:hypothetical protein CU044_6086 [Streptomyces sp. L-9-10]|uniref:DUF6578 domain-containing protein n=1 Tax=Streptomyces sp. L-9-10 TaxID=1478131 RepID=UPI00101CFC59|nr:DUF6578 domain-containing protein [Streptomyces sp. L-9-10]RYJ22035.1 hypothetical protein CU044_6086 [Streptomyces sp. L-9-10]